MRLLHCPLNGLVHTADDYSIHTKLLSAIQRIFIPVIGSANRLVQAFPCTRPQGLDVQICSRLDFTAQRLNNMSNRKLIFKFPTQRVWRSGSRLVYIFYITIGNHNTSRPYQENSTNNCASIWGIDQAPRYQGRDLQGQDQYLYSRGRGL